MAGALTRITEVEVSGCGQIQALIILARCQNLPSVQFHMAGPVASQGQLPSNYLCRLVPSHWMWVGAFVPVHWVSIDTLALLKFGCRLPAACHRVDQER
jgi:hypothetical protein